MSVTDGSSRKTVPWRWYAVPLSLVFALALVAERAWVDERVARAAPQYIDLIDGFADTEKRPAGQTFRIVDADVGSVVKRSIETKQPSRVTWTVRIPDRAALVAALGIAAADRHPDAAVHFAVGLSDGRLYERVLSQSVRADRVWVPIAIDLSRYAGFQWSIFYRPSTHPWQIVVGTTAENAGGNEAAALWGAPSIQRRR